MVCPKCGLPEEMCVCETIAKESQKIEIRLEEKRFKKKMTVIKGIDEKGIDIKSLVKKLKSRLACGGTFKNKEIELQGDHRNKIKDILVEEGFSEDIIEII